MKFPRRYTKEQIITNLRKGYSLYAHSRDVPELEDLEELQQQGLVTSELIIIDEQSSVLKWR